MAIDDEYKQLIDEYGSKFATAAANAKAEQGKLAAAREELSRLQAERDELQNQLAAFERGELTMTVDEFTAAADKVRWFDVTIRHVAGSVKQAEGAARSAGFELASIARAARSKVNALLQKEVETLTRERQAAIEAVLGGNADRKWPPPPKVEKAVANDRF